MRSRVKPPLGAITFVRNCLAQWVPHRTSPGRRPLTGGTPALLDDTVKVFPVGIDIDDPGGGLGACYLSARHNQIGTSLVEQRALLPQSAVLARP